MGATQARRIRNLAAALGQPAARLGYVEGEVTAVAAGAATDGNAQVTVTTAVGDLVAPYLDSYSPAVGHDVAVLLIDSSPLILGRPVGFPSP